MLLPIFLRFSYINLPPLILSHTIDQNWKYRNCTTLSILNIHIASNTAGYTSKYHFFVVNFSVSALVFGRHQHTNNPIRHVSPIVWWSMINLLTVCHIPEIPVPSVSKLNIPLYTFHASENVLLTNNTLTRIARRNVSGIPNQPGLFIFILLFISGRNCCYCWCLCLINHHIYI